MGKTIRALSAIIRIVRPDNMWRLISIKQPYLLIPNTYYAKCQAVVVQARIRASFRSDRKLKTAGAIASNVYLSRAGKLNFIELNKFRVIEGVQGDMYPRYRFTMWSIDFGFGGLAGRQAGNRMRFCLVYVCMYVCVWISPAGARDKLMNAKLHWKVNTHPTRTRIFRNLNRVPSTLLK